MRLFGRDSECATLDDLLAGARSGRSAALVLRGEAGVGKTALLQHARSAAPRAHAISGVESEADFPYAEGSVLANFQPRHQDTWVDYHNDNRAPLLFVSGSEDHIMPPEVQRSNHKHYKSRTTTEIREYEGYAHLLPAQKGWEQIADEVLDWALRHAR